MTALIAARCKMCMGWGLHRVHLLWLRSRRWHGRAQCLGHGLALYKDGWIKGWQGRDFKRAGGKGRRIDNRAPLGPARRAARLRAWPSRRLIVLRLSRRK